MPLGIGLQLGDLGGQLADRRDQHGDQVPECGVFGALAMRQDFFDDWPDVFGHIRVLRQQRALPGGLARAPREFLSETGQAPEQ